MTESVPNPKEAIRFTGESEKQDLLRAEEAWTRLRGHRLSPSGV